MKSLDPVLEFSRGGGTAEAAGRLGWLWGGFCRSLADGVMSPLDVDVPSSSSTTADRALIVYLRYYAFRRKHITGPDWRSHAERTGCARIPWIGIRADESRSTGDRDSGK